VRRRNSNSYVISAVAAAVVLIVLPIGISFVAKRSVALDRVDAKPAESVEAPKAIGDPRPSSVVDSPAPQKTVPASPQESAPSSAAANSTKAVSRPPGLEWFPLVEGSKYTYKSNGQQKKKVRTIEVRSHVADGVKGYYFIERGSDLLLGTSFGPGFYIPKSDGIHAAHATFAGTFRDLKVNDAASFLKAPLEPGQSNEFRVGPGAYKIEVMGSEDVKVPAGTFRNCRKVEVRATIGAFTDVYTAWLATGVGAVRWTGSDGRVEELTSFQIPTEPAPPKSEPKGKETAE
jgi:hypothetical protein